MQDIIDDPLDKNKLWLATHEGIRHFDKTTGELTTYLLMDSYPTFSVSLLGEKNGVDITEVDVITHLKGELAKI